MVEIQISHEDVAFIHEQLAKLRDQWKEEVKRIEKILKQLEEAIENA